MRLFCFGYGYSAEALALKLSPRLTKVAGTRTNPEAPAEAGAVLAAYKGDGPSAEVRSLLTGTTHLLVSIPPDLEGDAVLRDELYKRVMAVLLKRIDQLKGRGGY